MKIMGVIKYWRLLNRFSVGLSKSILKLGVNHGFFPGNFRKIFQSTWVADSGI